MQLLEKLLCFVFVPLVLVIALSYDWCVCCTLRYIRLYLCDISVLNFPQLDTEYRKKWDALVIKLEVVDRDPSTGSEIVHWATQFPVSFSTGSLKTLCHFHIIML